MEQRDELEIETRLRAALAARSELVTHSTLRPGVPPNEHTAGARNKRAGLWSWRRFLVPATVAAALAGGVFVGAQLPDDKSGNTVGAGASGGGSTGASGATSTASTMTTQATEPSSQAAPTQVAADASVAALHFTLADGWQVTAIDATSACVTPKARGAATPGGTAPGGTASGDAAAKSSGLPCGVDALYLKTDAVPDAWPLSTATKATGWWPKPVAAATDITCPAAKPGADDQVHESVLLRSSAKLALSAQATAEYHEWSVTCDAGAGVRPMLWRLKPAATAAADTKSAVATVVSSDPVYDAALLSMVGTLHLAG